MVTQSQSQDLIAFCFSIVSSILKPIIPILAILIAVCIVLFFIENRKYKKSTYYQITRNPYLLVRRDAGLLGEYMTYKYLKFFEEKGGKFLFNLYIPKEEGKTTEIDVLLICEKGIFVFESKNYSGWIFGNEYKRMWCQSLPRRKSSYKEYFYNPVMQNRTHIECLRNVIGNEVPVHSIIVFSERCELKNIQLKSDTIKVIKRNNVVEVVSELYRREPDIILNEQKIEEMYNMLYPYTQVSADVKAQHIADIKKETASETKDKEIAVESNPTDYEAAQSAPEFLKCPKCGGDLILRTSKRGQNAGDQFYGCSNFPKCRYIQNITELKNESIPVPPSTE